LVYTFDTYQLKANTMNLEFSAANAAPKQYAKIFTTGRSQAVRLPKAFRFEGTEVSVERQGDAVILRPKVQTKDEWWAAMEQSFNGFDDSGLTERDRSGLCAPVDFGVSGS
jgi:antitoxin VapB